MGEKKNELKEKFARLSADLFQKDTYVKALEHHVECLKESSQKLKRENQNFQVKKQENIAF